jgi:hypothetical protein
MPETYAGHPDYRFARDFKGYGEKGLEGLKWPNNAKVAVSFVINYEEVGQSTFAHRPIHIGMYKTVPLTDDFSGR